MLDYKRRIKFLEQAIKSGKSGKYGSILIDVCPQLAEWMLIRNVANRGLKLWYARELAHQYMSGNWVPNSGAPIVFDVRGNLVSGQHRLNMILLLQKEFKNTVKICFIVICGADGRAKFVDDTGRRKTPQDIIEVAGYKEAGKQAGAIVKQVVHGFSTGGRLSIPGIRMKDYVARMMDGIIFANKVLTGDGCLKTAPIKAVITRAFYARPESLDKIEAFCQMMSTGIPKQDSDVPLVALRDTIRTMEARRSQALSFQYRKIEPYLQFYIDGKEITNVLKPANEELFPIDWLDNPSKADKQRTYWAVPTKVIGILDEKAKDHLMMGHLRLGECKIKSGDKIALVTSTQLIGIATVVKSVIDKRYSLNNLRHILELVEQKLVDRKDKLGIRDIRKLTLEEFQKICGTSTLEPVEKIISKRSKKVCIKDSESLQPETVRSK